MGQLYYTPEQNGEIHQKQFLDCIRGCLEKRSKCLEENVWKEYRKNEKDVIESFHNAFLMGIGQLGGMIGTGKKQPVSYIQISYLLSGALSGERLLKIDFYDERYYADIHEIDCYWDYESLFPEYEEDIILLKSELKQAVPRITAYEIQKACIWYQIGNFIVLKTVIQDMMQKIKPDEKLGVYSASAGAVFYGAYLDQSEAVYKWDRG